MKKIISLITICALSISLMTGCGIKITPIRIAQINNSNIVSNSDKSETKNDSFEHAKYLY